MYAIIYIYIECIFVKLLLLFLLSQHNVIIINATINYVI